MKKFLALFALMFLASTGVAHAGYAGEDALVLSSSTVAAGGQLTLTAGRCEPMTDVTFTLGGVSLGSAEAGLDGQASLTTTVPSDLAPGGYLVQSTCTGVNGQALVLSATLTVDGAAGGGGGTSGDALPRTGDNSTIPMTQVAVAALAAGGLLVLMGNKRRTAREKTSVSV